MPQDLDEAGLRPPPVLLSRPPLQSAVHLGLLAENGGNDVCSKRHYNAVPAALPSPLASGVGLSKGESTAPHQVRFFPPPFPGEVLSLSSCTHLGLSARKRRRKRFAKMNFVLLSGSSPRLDVLTLSKTSARLLFSASILRGPAGWIFSLVHMAEPPFSCFEISGASLCVSALGYIPGEPPSVHRQYSGPAFWTICQVSTPFRASFFRCPSNYKSWFCVPRDRTNIDLAPLLKWYFSSARDDPLAVPERNLFVAASPFPQRGCAARDPFRVACLRSWFVLFSADDQLQLWYAHVPAVCYSPPLPESLG